MATVGGVSWISKKQMFQMRYRVQVCSSYVQRWGTKRPGDGMLWQYQGMTIYYYYFKISNNLGNRVHMICNKFSPSHYTDLPFEAESRSIHSAPNHIFWRLFQRILLVNYLVNPSWAHKCEILFKKVNVFMI